MIRMRWRLLSALCLAASLGACGDTLDVDPFFPATYKSSYVKMSACIKGAHPAGDYVVSWISPGGAAAWKAGEVVPEGTVLVKSQYTDSACKEQSRFTAMRKLKIGTAPAQGDWEWALLDDSRGVRECCAGDNGCVSCHTPCKKQDYICTKP